MVTMMKRRLLAPLASAIAVVMSAMIALAQTPTPDPVETTTRVTTTTWYGNWMVWAGVAVFLIVVIALTTRGSSRSS